MTMGTREVRFVLENEKGMWRGLLSRIGEVVGDGEGEGEGERWRRMGEGMGRGNEGKVSAVIERMETTASEGEQMTQSGLIEI